MSLKKLTLVAGLTLALSTLSACGGGGGGGSSSGSGGYTGGGSSSGGGSDDGGTSTGGGGTSNPPPIDSSDIIRFPYETVYGDACRSTSEVTPGCTFSRATGLRVTVSVDPTYNSQGYGADDLWYVQFDSSGRGTIKDDLGNFKKYASASEFAGYIAGTSGSSTKIGVGSTGAFWESVAGKTYWFGKNGVLYAANTGSSNYGQAINNKKANQASNSNSKAIRSAANVALIKAGAAKLQQLGLSASKATAVASAMNSMAVMSVERGAITETDYNRVFKTMTGGVEYRDALSAFRSFIDGDKAPARELSNRSASALGLSAEEGEAYIKALYKTQLSKWGYDVDQISLKD